MNINKKLLGCVLMGAAVVASVGAAENVDGGAAKAAATSTADDKISQYINGNLFGVQSIKKDADGRIISLVSIGRAAVSTTLTKAKAKNQAIKKADANARAEFMKWLTTAVVYTRIDQDEIAIVQQGENGKVSAKSEATELTQEEVVSVAAGFVKGMVQIGAGVNDDGEAVVVLGWSAATAGETDAVRKLNTPGCKPKAECPKKGNAASQVETPAKSMSVSDAAGEFL